ncbi:MAG TPA: hypothetical protein VMU11_03895 [Verrucomicrobiae bacterium]|nr:hypothetical protein [Verrucomicrobiae bacterium]
MSSTPKPSPAVKGDKGKADEEENVIPLGKRRREREGTIEYDRRSGETRVPGGLRQRDDTPTDRMLTTPDGLPPGEAHEIVVELRDLAPVHKSPFDALPLQTFAKGVVIRHESETRGPVYYKILSGSAHMRSVDEQGRPKDNPRDLKEGDFIGLTGGVRVVARTDVRVRVYDMRTLHNPVTKDLLIAVQGELFGASAAESMNKDFENARLREENARQRELLNQQSAVIQGRLDELKEQVVQPLRRELRDRNAEVLSLHEQLGKLTARLAIRESEIAALTPWVEELFERVPVLLDEITIRQDEVERLLKDRKADAESLELMLDEFDGFVEQGVLDASEKRVAELVSIMEPLLTAMSTCGDMVVMQKAMHAMGELHTFKMKMRKAPTNR